MNFKYLRLVTTVLFFCFITSCSSDESSTTPSSGSLNGAATVITSAKSNLAKSKIFDSSSLLSHKDDFFYPTAVNGDWTTTHITDPGGDDCATMTAAKGYMQEMSNNSCTISPFFDLDNALNLLCVAANELAVTDGLPDVVASKTITVSASTASLCGLTDASGSSVTVAVTATGTQTYYQRRLDLTISGDPRAVLMGTSGTSTYFAFNYNRSSDQSVYRGFYHYDSATSLTKFELQAMNKTNSKATVYRILIDESESPGEAYALGTKSDDNSTYVRWSYGGPLTTVDFIGVQMAWANQTSGTGVSTCIDPANSFVSDGTVSTNCGTDSYSAKSIAAFGTKVNDAYTIYQGLSTSDFLTNMNESDIVSFDDTNIESSGIVE